MPECLDKNTSKITESIFLNFFSENSQVVASRHLPQHGSQEDWSFPVKPNPKDRFGPSIPGGQMGRNRVSSLPTGPNWGHVARHGTRCDHRGVFCPLLFASPSDRSDRWSVVEWISTNGRFSKDHQLTAFQIQDVQPSWEGKVAFVKSGRLKGFLKKKKGWRYEECQRLV